nr:glycosyltransferase family 1 protein [uncultured Tistrella sp.]
MPCGFLNLAFNRLYLCTADRSIFVCRHGAPKRAFRPKTPRSFPSLSLMHVVGLNLAFLTPGVPGGMATYSWSLLRELVALKRYELMVFVQAGTALPSDLASKVRVVEVPQFSGRFQRVIWEQTILPRIARRHRVHLMFSPGNTGPLLGDFRKVVTIHDLMYAMVPGSVERYQARFRQVMDRLTARTADAVIAVSETTASDIRAKGLRVGTRLHVVHEAAGPGFGPDDPEDAIGACAHGPFIMMVASVLPHKSPQTVVQAAARLWQHAGIRTVILGTDPYGTLAAALARSGDVGITRLHGVSTPVLAAHYRRAVCLVMPSEYEGFGLPILEAQLCGCPVVTTRRGALPEVAGDAALYIEPADADALVAAVSRLVDDEALRQHLILRGQANVGRFSWNKAAAQTAAIFDACLARPHKSR